MYTPGATALPALANIATSIAVPSLAATQFVAPCVDEFLRPPIAWSTAINRSALMLAAPRPIGRQPTAEGSRTSLASRIAEVSKWFDLDSNRDGDSCKGLRAARSYLPVGGN
jgi:hypothetical protein